MFIDVARIPGIARYVARVVAEGVVVVGDRHDAVAATPANLTAPRIGEGAYRTVEHELDGVRTLGRVGQVTDRQIARELVRRERGLRKQGVHEGTSCRVGERSGKPLVRRAEPGGSR